MGAIPHLPLTSTQKTSLAAAGCPSMIDRALGLRCILRLCASGGLAVFIALAGTLLTKNTKSGALVVGSLNLGGSTELLPNAVALVELVINKQAITDLIDRHAPALARMVAATSWLPSANVVHALGRAVFPTVRYTSDNPRFSSIQIAGATVGMYDDNATPEWALFWSHGLQGTRPKGWVIAHVWPTSHDINSYTHLANLAMVREPFASLTEKVGPLTEFLRWHAWIVFGWKPQSESVPQMPLGFDSIVWRYLAAAANPQALIQMRIEKLNNQRVRTLRKIVAK